MFTILSRPVPSAPRVTAQDGLAAVRIAVAAGESARTGQAVETGAAAADGVRGTNTQEVAR